MDNKIINVQNLTKTFNEKEVIYRCNMTVPQGVIYGFLGANGAGKTTIFKLITGLLNPTYGQINILGLDIETNHNKILKQLGCMIESPIFYDNLSATENLEIHLKYMGTTDANIEKTLNDVGLVSTGKKPVSQFSLGMRQRLGIARAIIHKPRILILDEPINGLDPMGIREMRELFIRLVKEENMTILISSHILSEIEYMADIIGVIVNGSIVEEITLASIKEKFPNGLEDYFFNIMSGGNTYV
ncbi:ATP-binding cassette domain-containing protein [Clostridioides difficile]|nr:ATP-binding cassette domain-containing protein [Clostridioides difficile]